MSIDDVRDGFFRRGGDGQLHHRLQEVRTVADLHPVARAELASGQTDPGEEAFNERFHISREHFDKEIKQRLALGKDSAHEIARDLSSRGRTVDSPAITYRMAMVRVEKIQRLMEREIKQSEPVLKREMVHGPKIGLRIDRS